MYREDVRERYMRTLATGGKGTLRTRLTDLPSGVRVHAKTGTFTGVSGLAGYMTSERTQPLAFVILMQNFIGESAPFRAVQDRIVQRCVEAVTAAQNSVRQPR
jgi:D-alanyl-D-alanine carboxypeptidase/D-alanyl-D-alanine-endopeptidase (penicillin-binding protein 4)